MENNNTNSDPRIEAIINSLSKPDRRKIREMLTNKADMRPLQSSLIINI